MDFNRYPIRVPAKSQVMLKEDDLKDHVIQTRDLKFIRGHFIDLMVEIEERINLLIEKSFIPKNSNYKFCRITWNIYFSFFIHED